MKRIRIVCVDFDGTITLPQESSWEKIGRTPPSFPNEKIVKLLRFLRDNGVYIYVNSARLDFSWQENKPWVKGRSEQDFIFAQRDEMIKYLLTYRIPFDQIVDKKPYADVYIDDRALNPVGIPGFVLKFYFWLKSRKT